MTTTPPAPSITAVGLAAFVKLTAPLLRIIEGKGTIVDDEAAANAVMDAIALFDPAATPIIDLIEDAEPFIAAYIGGVQNGFITGGVSPSWTPGGGPGPRRGQV